MIGRNMKRILVMRRIDRLIPRWQQTMIGCASSSITNSTNIIAIPLQHCSVNQYTSTSVIGNSNDNRNHEQNTEPQEAATQVSNDSSSSSSVGSTSTITKMPWSMDWRRIQLENLESKHSSESIMQSVKDDDELQDTWKSMESRVRNRKSSRTLPVGRSSGRENIQKTDEDIWLQHGLYDSTSTRTDQDNNINNDKNNGSK